MKAIKSIYISKIIFSFLDEQRKLKLIKHNKNIQKYLNMDIFNYRIKSGRYIIYETEVKAIEYYYDFKDRSKIFEGEYSNGQRNGKGKEFYNNGILRFEGEYLNGNRHGNGKKYLSNGKLFFEGEYRFGEKNGKGKIYFDGKIIFEGFLVNGKKFDGIGYDLEHNKLYELKNGKGYIKEFYADYFKLMYEGEYLNGMRNGKGKEYDFYGYIIFAGEYLNGRRWNGKGYYCNTVIYELKNGNGYVKDYFCTDILRFECEFKNGQKNGHGKDEKWKRKRI